MDRNCDKCIHHTSGMCDSWDCKMQTVEGFKKEVREKAIEEFAEKLCDAISEQYANVEVNGIKFDVLTVDGITEIAWDLAEQLIGE